MISGKYVSTFPEASHALPSGMHMNADYPFMLPKIKSLNANYVTLEGRGGQTITARIERNSSGLEYCVIQQSSTFEELYRRKPQKFTCHPFKDENTPIVSPDQPDLFREGGAA